MNRSATGTTEAQCPRDGTNDGSAGTLITETIPEFRSGAWRLLSSRITAERRRLRRRIVFYRVSYLDGSHGPAQTVEMVAKVYSTDRGTKAYETLRQLWQAGLRPPARYQVPRPYGYSPKLGSLLQAAVKGRDLAEFLQGDRASRQAASGRAAAWLLRLQRIPISRSIGSSQREASAPDLLANALASKFGGDARQLEGVVERLTQRLRSDGEALVISHGDYHPRNIFLSRGVTSVLDFDTFGQREAAFDVGYAIGQLLIMSYLRLREFAPGAECAHAFWRRYETTGTAAWPSVSAHVARTLLQSLHYELCTLLNNRTELLTLWPDLMEEWLDSEGPATLENLIRRS